MSRHWRSPQPARVPLRLRDLASLSVLAIAAAVIVGTCMTVIAGAPTPLERLLTLVSGGA